MPTVLATVTCRSDWQGLRSDDLTGKTQYGWKCMKQKPLNQSLSAAKASKQDEFYTQLSDIEKELRHYTKHFKGKTVLCNCDDPRVSNFFHYFSHNFEKLKLKKLIATC